MAKRTVLDRMIGYISPEAEARRLHARIVTDRLVPLMGKRSYEGAARGKRLGGWQSTSSSVNSETQAALSVLRARSRDLVRNNPWAEKAVSAIASNVVGAGILPQAASSDKGIRDEHERLWIAWGDEALCDADGALDFYGLQALALRTVVESGECLVRRHWARRSDGLPVPMQIQVMEPDFLDTSKDMAMGDGSRIIQGVEFDRRGKRVAYWLFDEHPGDMTGYLTSLNSRRVPVGEILHLRRILRPGQVRGIPWGAPCVVRLKDLDECEDAYLIRQKIAACYTFFVHDMELDEFTDVVKKDSENDLVEVGPGTVSYLPKGKTVSFGSPPPVTGYAEHVSHVLHSIAAGFGVTYEALTGDYSRVNFSSGRMGWIEFHRSIETWRNHMMIPQLCKGVWRWFTEAAQIAGLVSEPATATWTPPRREMIDPVKELNAMKARVRNGFVPLSEAIRELGYDPEWVFGEIKNDYEILDKLGLKLDTDPRKDPAKSLSDKEEK